MLKHRILIIEDDLSLVQMLQLVFRWDFEVVTAPDGFVGFQQAQVIEPDLIILDIVMPHMDGYQFCETIRNIPSLQNIPVVVITGKAIEDVEERLKKMGISTIVQKPFASEALLEQVNKLLYHIPPTPKKVPLNEIQ
jgi:DNA-binding response OmpR family regulator